MRIELLGVRGSTRGARAGLRPLRRPHVVRRGLGRGSDRPSLVLDAGTGCGRCRRGCTARPTTGPSCSATCTGTTCRVSVLRRRRPGRRPGGCPYTGTRGTFRPGPAGAVVLTAGVSRSRPKGCAAAGRFHALPRRRPPIEGFAVTAVDVEHKGGRTFGYRIERRAGARWPTCPTTRRPPGCSAALLEILVGSGRSPARRTVPGGRAPVAGTTATRPSRTQWRSALECGVRTLVLFHHSPARSDVALDEMASWARARR